MTSVKRALTPALNPTGLGSAIAAVYAAVVMIANAVSHHGVINPQVIVAAIAAAAFLFARGKVTPVADPRDGNGNPLAVPPAGPALWPIGPILPPPSTEGGAILPNPVPSPPPPPEAPTAPPTPVA